MMKRPGIALVVLLLAQAGCDPVPVQYPPGSNPYPNANNPSAAPAQPQFQISGCQRGPHVWSSIMEGVAMGSAIAGPYGAGAGLVVGLIKHAFTFESECAQLHAKIGSEQQKDQQLEAAIEQELERQRALETQISGASATVPQSTSLPAPAATQSQAPPSKPNPQVKPAPDRTVLASLGKPTAPAPPASPFKNVDVRDTNGDGVPDLWIY